MKTAWMIGLMAAVGLVAQTRETTPEVTAYTSSEPLVPALTLAQAEDVAARIFAEIGVPIRWRDGQPPKDSQGKMGVTLWIRLRTEAARVFWLGALARTAPEDGQPVIDVYYSRVAAASYRIRLVPVVLGYVLAHEMAHVLQGAGRHSSEGIMKAKWVFRDYLEMEAGQLAFTTEDTMLIRRWVVAATAQFKFSAQLSTR